MSQCVSSSVVMIRRLAQVSNSFVILLVLTLALATSSEARSWAPVGAPGGNVRTMTQDPRDPRRIYLGTSNGILYRSDDGGLQWRRLSPGFPLRGCSLDEIVV